MTPRKVRLIEEEELKRLRDQQLTSYDQRIRSITTLMDQMDSILHRPVTAEQKVMAIQDLYSQIKSLRPGTIRLGQVSQHLDYDEPIPVPIPVPLPVSEPPATSSTDSSHTTDTSKDKALARIVGSFPGKSANQAKQFLAFISDHPEIINFDEKAQLIVRGKPIPRSNLIDLVKSMISHQSQTSRVIGQSEFVKALQDINLPQHLIPNISMRAELLNTPSSSSVTPSSSKRSKKRSTSFLSTQTGTGFFATRNPHLLYKI